MGVAVWHAARETLEEEEVMDFGVWHLQQQKKTKKKQEAAEIRIKMWIMYNLKLYIQFRRRLIRLLSNTEITGCSANERYSKPSD